MVDRAQAHPPLSEESERPLSPPPDAAHHGALRNVLPPGPGVCALCRRFFPHEGDLCKLCASQPNHLDAVIPVSYAIHGAYFHQALRDYKASPDSEARARAALLLVRILSSFLTEHAACLGSAAGLERFDIVTTVPSTRLESGRSGVASILAVAAPAHFPKQRRLLRPTGLAAGVPTPRVATRPSLGYRARASSSSTTPGPPAATPNPLLPSFAALALTPSPYSSSGASSDPTGPTTRAATVPPASARYRHLSTGLPAPRRHACVRHLPPPPLVLTAMTTIPISGPPLERLAYRPAELAALVGLSLKTIYREIDRGELSAARVARGSRLLIPAQAANDWLASHVVDAEVEPTRRRRRPPRRRRALAAAMADLDRR
jgi:excisionase family DNA binding protein